MVFVVMNANIFIVMVTKEAIYLANLYDKNGFHLTSSTAFSKWTRLTFKSRNGIIVMAEKRKCSFKTYTTISLLYIHYASLHADILKSIFVLPFVRVKVSPFYLLCAKKNCNICFTFLKIIISWKLAECVRSIPMVNKSILFVSKNYWNSCQSVT